ncbi:hypothetical protein NEMBOFW57_000266 [Staphylotrichum longicolle]|uniref:BRCT domain-containing protein n=1 Tax=Staphylotrichum longicolle TaxID=669026 RepID=A0AAD4HZP7_9PEZI|nr:hypothetical protein NEMBOFW57_000266 [Staphylotrichum longicolle]
MRVRKEKPIFRGLTIAGAGNLGGSAQWTDANIARWVELREGKFVRVSAGPGHGSASASGPIPRNGDVIPGADGGGGGGGGGAGCGHGKVGKGLGEEVTHVVCTGEEFRRMGGVVKAALKRPKTCQIITLDWLEDSMFAKRRLPEEPYSHLRVLKRERERERMRLRVIKGLEKAVREVNPNLYHIYCDDLFWYKVELTREGEEAGVQERYELSLFESNNARPHLYWFVAKYFKKKGDSQPKIHRPSHAPGVFAREFAEFEDFFRIKTGIPWAQRLIKAGTTEKTFFQYQPPTGGKPVGWVPAECIPADAVEVATGDGAVRNAHDSSGQKGPKSVCTEGK